MRIPTLIHPLIMDNLILVTWEVSEFSLMKDTISTVAIVLVMDAIHIDSIDKKIWESSWRKINLNWIAGNFD